MPKVKIVKNPLLVLHRYIYLQCTDQCCTAKVNGKISVQREVAAPPGQFIALQAFNALKGIFPGYAENNFPVRYELFEE